jgi:hypothetical protein
VSWDSTSKGRSTLIFTSPVFLNTQGFGDTYLAASAADQITYAQKGRINGDNNGHLIINTSPETLYNFNLPTLSAIGHQIDNPLSDLVCDYSAPTPSLAAQFIVDYNKNYLKSYQKILKEITNVMNIKLINELEKTNNLFEKLNKKWLSFERNNKQKLMNELNNMLRKLDNFESRLEMYDTTNILLNGNGKIMHNKEDLLEYKGKNLEIIWNGIIVKVKIESISNLI